jgi:hypothetical protein
VRILAAVDAVVDAAATAMRFEGRNKWLLFFIGSRSPRLLAGGRGTTRAEEEDE